MAAVATNWRGSGRMCCAICNGRICPQCWKFLAWRGSARFPCRPTTQHANPRPHQKLSPSIHPGTTKLVQSIAGGQLVREQTCSFESDSGTIAHTRVDVSLPFIAGYNYLILPCRCELPSWASPRDLYGIHALLSRLLHELIVK